MSNKLIKESGGPQKKSSSYEVFTAIIEFTLAVIGVAFCLLVPLYLKDGYHSVGTVKYDMYRYIVLWGLGVVILITLGWLMSLKELKVPKLNDTDWCVVAFLVLSVIAAFAGGNFEDCVWGYNGWDMGLLSMLSFGLIYFYYSRFGKGNKVVLTVLFFSAFIAFCLGILHRLMIDPIGVYSLGKVDELADTYKNQFLSTLGQATWYSSFVCTVLPLGIGIFWSARKRWLRIVSGIFSLAGFCTMVTQNSDSAYAALLGFMAVFLWFSLPDVKRMERFAEILLLFVLATRIMNLLFLVHPNEILILDKLSSFLVFHKWMWGMLVLAVLFWGLFFWLSRKEKYVKGAALVVRRILYALLALVILAAAGHVILSAKGRLPESITQYTSRIPYLIWGDGWGNGRGKTWSFSIQMYKDMDIFHKLFGVGPDGYAPYAYSLYQDRLAQMWGDRTLTNAHNEWMNALINYGLIGTAAYVGIFFTSIKNFAKKQENMPVMAGFIACIVSYMSHNFFCYQQICCTPFLFLIIGAGMYLIRRRQEELSAS